MQLLQLSIPQIAAQLPFSLVACCRGGVQRGGVYNTGKDRGNAIRNSPLGRIKLVIMELN